MYIKNEMSTHGSAASEHSSNGQEWYEPQRPHMRASRTVDHLVNRLTEDRALERIGDTSVPTESEFAIQSNDQTVADVTVILAAFNGERYIDQAIESVRKQTLEEWRLIVIDDGSTDDTASVVERYVSMDERISLIQQTNAGVSSARNRGLEAANTKWVALLDQDDVYLPRKLERQLQYLRVNPEVKCLGAWGNRIGSQGKALGKFNAGPTTRREFSSIRQANRLVYLLAASVVFDRTLAFALGGFRDEPGGTDDIDLWNRIADHHQVRALSDRLVLYRVHGNSESTTKLHVQRLNSERIKLNMRLRRDGKPEVSFRDFVDEWERRPDGVKRAARRTTTSLVMYRRAGALLADRNPLGLWFLLCSICLRPAQTMRRLIDQLGPREKS